MIAAGFEGISFTDSYVLGWERKGEDLTLHVELLLSIRHPQVEPYDKRKEHGCYKLGRILVSGCSSVVGLPTDSIPLRQDDDRGEYVDVAVICSIDVRDGTLIIDTLGLDTVEIKGRSCAVVFD